jgi:hypothetical protein
MRLRVAGLASSMESPSTEGQVEEMDSPSEVDMLLTARVRLVIVNGLDVLREKEES